MRLHGPCRSLYLLIRRGGYDAGGYDIALSCDMISFDNHPKAAAHEGAA